jgi:hypothetical protein
LVVCVLNDPGGFILGLEDFDCCLSCWRSGLIVHESGLLEARLAIHGSHVIPSEIKSLLKSGKLSTKAMPVGRFNELHQDYVCSCALRVARELLAILPDDLVIVTALDNVLNSSTGHVEELPILSVAFSRITLNSLNLDAIDPSDAMKNEEGPVLDSVLARRIARAHGWVRTGARIRDRVDQLAHAHFRAHEEEQLGTFFWPASLQSDSAVVFRRPGDDDSVRSLVEICLQELAALVG